MCQTNGTSTEAEHEETDNKDTEAASEDPSSPLLNEDKTTSETDGGGDKTNEEPLKNGKSDDRPNHVDDKCLKEAEPHPTNENNVTIIDQENTWN